MLEKAKIEIRSYLSCDAYVFEGMPYRLNEIDKLKNKVGDRDVEFIKGRNTFTGMLVDQEFFESMKKHYFER